MLRCDNCPCQRAGAGNVDTRSLTRRDNDDDEQDDDAYDEAHAHLHVLPPHLLAHAVGSPSEALGRRGEVVGLVLQRIQTGTSFRDLVDVVAHDADGAVDFLVLSARMFKHSRCKATSESHAQAMRQRTGRRTATCSSSKAA